jgi:hypothetical protein
MQDKYFVLPQQGDKPSLIYLCGMELTQGEEQFIAYWASNREQKKKVLRNLSVGLPLSVLFVFAIFVNFFSGWYKRAGLAMMKEDASLILVLVIAAVLIVCFVVIFSARHKWDLQEQQYRELLARRRKA